MKFKQWLSLSIVLAVILLGLWYYFFFDSMQLGMVIIGGVTIITLAFFLGYYTALHESRDILFLTKPLMLLGLFIVSYFLVRNVAESQLAYGFYMFGGLFLILTIYLLKITYITERKAYILPSAVALFFVFFALASIDLDLSFSASAKAVPEVTIFLDPIPNVGLSIISKNALTVTTRFKNAVGDPIREFESYNNNSGDCGMGALAVLVTDCAGEELGVSIPINDEFCVTWTCSANSTLATTLTVGERFEASRLGFSYENWDTGDVFEQYGNVTGNITE